MPDEVLHVIAARYTNNIRELEGSLTRILAYARLTGEPLTMSLVSEAWRTPHNGYLSALGRGGVIALMFYLVLALDAVRALLFLRRVPERPLIHLLYFCGCADALTQTVFDSPYSLFLVICAGACSTVMRGRHAQSAIPRGA